MLKLATGSVLKNSVIRTEQSQQQHWNIRLVVIPAQAGIQLCSPGSRLAVPRNLSRLVPHGFRGNDKAGADADSLSS